MSKPITLVIPAAGAGLRLNPQQPKQFLEYQGLRTLEWTLKAFEPISDRLVQIVIALPSEYLDSINLTHSFKNLHLTAGGTTRQESVYNGLAYLDKSGNLKNSHCLVHDAARPLLHREDLETLVLHLDQEDSPAILAIPVKDTLKKANDRRIEKTVSRAELWQAQTPQAAKGESLYEAHLKARQEGWSVTDDASVLEQAGHRVSLIESQHLNFKITTPQDWELFKRLI